MSQPAAPFRVSVIVVTYQTKEHLRRCLSSLQGQAHEVIVVDNASRDGSPDMVEQDFPAVRLIRSKLNLGFGRANNLGLETMTGDLALILNSDAEAEPGAVNHLASAFADSEVIAAGGQLLNADGSIQESACRPLTLWAVFCEQTMLEKVIARLGMRPPYWQSRWLTRTPGVPSRGEVSPGETPGVRVDQVMGACLMMRIKETCLERANGPLGGDSYDPLHSRMFDPRFFLYCEDTELCHRLSKLGKILYVPGARFQHALGASTSENRWWSVAMYNRGKELFFSIHHGPSAVVLCWILNRFGALLRLLVWTVLLKPRQVRLFWNVLTAPWKGPRLPDDSRSN